MHNFLWLIALKIKLLNSFPSSNIVNQIFEAELSVLLSMATKA